MGRLDRRGFLKAGAALGASMIALNAKAPGQEAPPSAPAVPKAPAKPLPAVKGALELRELGRSGRKLPRLGLGTAPIGVLEDEAQAIATIERAHQAGVRYFDTAPSYNDGRAERRVGAALKGAKREELWIATKTLERGADGARRELEASLKRLQLDYVDSVQVHAVSGLDFMKREDSVLAGLQKAIEEKLVRAIGITSHCDPKWLMEAVGRFPFTTALCPVNAIDPQHKSFARQLLPRAAEAGVAVIAMKVFAAGRLIHRTELTASDCLTWTLAQPQVSVIIPGCDHPDQVDAAYSVAAGYVAPSAEELAKIEARAGKHQGKESEWYKDV